MKFARYWTRGQGEATDAQGQSIQVVSRGWSDESIEQAQNVARERARRLAQRIAVDRSARNQYDYGDAPVPEPIIRDFRSEGLAAVVTRNSYGSLVLNTDELAFADLDDGGHEPAAQQPSLADFASGSLGDTLSGLFSLFGGKQPSPAPHGPTAPKRPSNSLLERVQRVAESHGLAGRVYRTAAGYRLMVTNRRIRGGGNEAETLLNEFGSDPMYIRLCRTQESFRARLTPKPWRCDVRKPPVKFPFEGAGTEAAFRDWEAEYSQRIAGYAVCRLVTTFGDGVDPAFHKLIEYHDQETKATSDLPLA
jgi:hypothetical protein